MTDIPLHRLNSAQTKLWLIDNRPTAAFLAKTYRCGVGVLSATLRLIAYVQPDGIVRPLPPPHKRYEMWQIANMPSVQYNECACRNFWDPENGRWAERNTNQHHPFCQFDQTAQAVFERSQQVAVGRLGEGLSAQARPDEWERLRQEYRGR